MTSSRGKPERILVVKFHAIGDLILVTPALRDLRKAHPSAHIALLVGTWSAPVVRHDPHLDEVIEFNPDIFLRRRWFAILKLLRKIRRGRFDTAVILHALGSIQFFIRLTGIPRRFGMSRKGVPPRFLTSSVPEKLGPDTYYARKYQEVAALAGATPGEPRSEIHAAPGDEAIARGVLEANGLLTGTPFLLVAPGGGRNPKDNVAAKRWPPERFAELVQERLRDTPELRVVLAGAESDRGETSVLARRIPEAIDLTGTLTLTQLACVVRSAKAVLCNDSSILHISHACGVPAVAAFGPTSARQLVAPWALPYALQSKGRHSPCHEIGNGEAFTGCEHEDPCILEISVEEMRPLLDRALGGAPLR